MDLTFLYYEQTKIFKYFADFRQVTIMGHFADFVQVKIISHLCRFWASQDYGSFLQPLGKSKIFTKLL